MDEQSRTDRARQPAPAGATVGGPTYGARPSPTRFAASRSGLAALPGRPPPSPHFTGRREPKAGRPLGIVRPAWYRHQWLWVLASLVIVLVVGAAALLANGGQDEGIRATAGAPAPQGYRMVRTDSYRFAIPRPWTTKSLDAQVMNPAATATGVLGQLVVASDPASSDTINVVPYHASGASLQKRVLAQFETDFRTRSGTQIVTLRVDPATVHGFAAGRLVASVIGKDGPAKVISTVVETDHGLYQITVTSTAADRAARLDRAVLPTFDTR